VIYKTRNILPIFILKLLYFGLHTFKLLYYSLGICNHLTSTILLLSFERVLLLSTASPPGYRGRCWAAIRLSHRPEQPGRVVRGEVDGLGSGEWHGRRIVLQLHTRKPQRRPYPICTSRSEKVRHRCGGGWAGPRLFLGGSFRGVYWCLEIKCRVLWGCPPTPRSIDDPPTAPHICCCCSVVTLMRRPLRRTDVVELLYCGYKWVSRFEAPCSCTRWTGECCVEQVSRLMARRPRDSVAPLRWSSAGWTPARIGRLFAGVGRMHPVTIHKASLMVGSIRRVWALRHQTGAQYSAVE